MKCQTSIAIIATTALLGACSTSSTSSTSRAPARTNTTTMGARTGAASTAADARVLSILHAKNREEVEIGRMAQQKGTTDDIRAYGGELVRDHTDNDAQVVTAARSAGVSLMEPADVKQMLERERPGAGPAPDPVAELAALNGADFDRAFVQTMRDGHAEAVRLVQAAQPDITTAPVRDLLARTLPVLRKHQESAARLTTEVTAR